MSSLTVGAIMSIVFTGSIIMAILCCYFGIRINRQKVDVEAQPANSPKPGQATRTACSTNTVAEVAQIDEPPPAYQPKVADVPEQMP